MPDQIRLRATSQAVVTLPRRTLRRGAGIPTSFRPRDLLTVDMFIKECERVGIRVSRDALEFYESEGLLFPAVRIFPGVVPLKRVLMSHQGRQKWMMVNKGSETKVDALRVESRTYYHRGAFSMGDPNWFSWFRDRNMIEFPECRRFKPWSSYALRSSRTPRLQVTNPRELAHLREIFYSRTQMFPVMLLHDHYAGQFRGERLVSAAGKWDAAAWRRLGTFFAARFRRDKLLERLAEWAAFLPLYHDLLDLADRTAQEWHQVATAELEQPQRDREHNPERSARAHANARLKFGEAARRAEVKILLERNGFSQDQIVAWRRSLAMRAYFSDREIVRIEYLDDDERALLSDAADSFRFAEASYVASQLLAWVLRQLGATVPEFAALVTFMRGVPHCLICSRPFKQGRRNQITCGSKKCKRDHQNQIKKRLRKAGITYKKPRAADGNLPPASGTPAIP